MPRRSAEKLTKRFIDTLAPVAGKDFTIWDSDLTGFGVRVKPSGAKSYEIKYYAPDGRQRKKAIGKVGHLTLDEARKLARVKLGKVAGGGDPVAEAKREKGRMTIEELCDRYYRDAEAGRILYRNRPKKPSTLAVDNGRIERHIKPLCQSAFKTDPLSASKIDPSFWFFRRRDSRRRRAGFRAGGGACGRIGWMIKAVEAGEAGDNSGQAASRFLKRHDAFPVSTMSQ